VKKKIVEKPPRNSAGFCGGGQGLSWAVEPRKQEERIASPLVQNLGNKLWDCLSFLNILLYSSQLLTMTMKFCFLTM
jgi:hypothetical protein